MSEIIVADHMVESSQAGLSVFVRNKRLADRHDFGPSETVLCIHGATYPSTVTFDYQLEGGSWMDILARAGFDVWCVDLLGYGASDRPAEMSVPAEDNPPIVDTDDAVADVTKVIDFILEQRNLPRLALIGYSWGTLIGGTYAGQQPDKVERLVLYGAAWMGAGGAISTGVMPGAYRMVDAEAVITRWCRELDDEQIASLGEPGHMAAWADVARRIAHEIKNPLTPIQLSAERLKRKYLSEISTDPDVFESCTDTIIRQVGDIGRMVDEFSSFARMPEPELLAEDLDNICAEGVFLESNRDRDINVNFVSSGQRTEMLCDRQQISRAISNIIKNAIESVGARQSGEGGQIDVSLKTETENDVTHITLAIEDNGVGLPDQERNRLTEPYVTTRDKGTGLGLAIVKKIVEEHHGELILEDAPSGGARISMIFQPENG